MVLKVAFPGKVQFRMVNKDTRFLMTKQGDIHYIGGTEVLPPPLESEKENEIISDLGTEYEDEAKAILIEHNLRLVVYIAKKFEEAEVERSKDNYAHSALYYMNEQIYAANSNVNDILKIYFPEQFGERNFLDYPIGHFFIAITNLWDAESKGMLIQDINDIYECLSCGIIAEGRKGQVSGSFFEE